MTSLNPLRRRPLLGLLIALSMGALVLGACSSTQSTGTEISDAAIATKIEAKLVGDPEVNPFNVDVDVNEGVVRLSGKVDDEVTRQEAEKLATNTEGVRSVINDLEIGDSSIGERLDDAGLTAKIKAKLAADPEINPFDIDVDVDDGKVTLTGRVERDRQKQHAEQLARATKGVESVVNRLVVGDLTRSSN